MKLTTKEDTEVPIEVAFKAVSDFASFERSALRREVEVEPFQNEDGARAWNIGFNFRGKARKMTAHVAEFDAPNGYTLAGTSGGLEGELDIELVALSKKRTRITVTMHSRANTLAARLLLQSIKLAKNNLNRRFRKRVAKLATDLEDRYAHGQIA